MKYLLIDYWDLAKEIMIPYAWFTNGTYKMLNTYGIFDCYPKNQNEYIQSKKYTTFVVRLKNDTVLEIDLNGNIIQS